MENERYLTVEESAQLLQVHEQTVRRWLRSGFLKGTLISRRAGYRIRRSEVQRVLDGGGDLEESTSDPAEPGRQ
jgi:excisionase family DNA binding protein